MQKEIKNPNSTAEKSKNVTIADVAKAAGVSLGTVSRVINNKDGIIKVSEGTMNRVLEAAKELGYKPNPFAAALRSQRSGAIGVIVRDINDPFLRQIISDVQKVSHKKGIEILIGHAEYELETAERQMNLMVNHWFDGLVLLGNLPGDEKIIHMIYGKSTPMISVASGFNMEIPSIDFDNEYGAKIALDHLYNYGHTRIAFVGDREHAGVAQRLEAYRAYIAQHGLVQEDGYILSNTKTRTEALERTRQLLELPVPPTAIFCASDHFALGAISGAWQIGKQVPKDVSIIGYDDIEEAAEAFIPLTTVKQSTEQAANNVLELLLDMIENPSEEMWERKVELKPELIVRNTCAKPRR